LKFEKTILDDHQAQIVVEVGAEQLEAAKRRAARKLARRGKVPGFRPGKAPYDVVLRYYGEEAVHEQAMDLLVDEVYPEMLKEADVEPAAAGLLEKVDDAEPPKLTFKVPLKPEVALGDYNTIRVPYEFKEPGPERLEQALKDLRQMYATTETVDREAQAGDYVVVDMKSENKSFERQDFSTIVRSEDQPEAFPYPGFSAELVGMNAGETRSLKHTFPADSKDADLAGKEITVEVTVKAVRSVSMPALDDEFAKTVGKYDSLEALKGELSKDLLARDRADYDDEYYTRVVDELRKAAVVKYAPQTLEHEAEHVVNDMRSRLAQQGLDLETYYKMRNTDAGKFMEEEAKPMAQKRLERSLILDEVARQEKIEVDDQSLDEEFNSTLVDLQTQGVNLAAVRGGRQGQRRVAEAVAMQSANRLLTRRTLERLRAIATGESKTAPGKRSSEGTPAEDKASVAASTESADKPDGQGGS
jgi:trigger factor